MKKDEQSLVPVILPTPSPDKSSTEVIMELIIELKTEQSKIRDMLTALLDTVEALSDEMSAIATRQQSPLGDREGAPAAPRWTLPADTAMWRLSDRTTTGSTK